MLRASMLALLLTGLALWMTGCASSPAPRSDACGWLRPIIVDPGYETRLTLDERKQILAFDDKVTAFCPAMPTVP